MSEPHDVWPDVTAKGKVVLILLFILFSPMLILLKVYELITEEVVKWDDEKNKNKRPKVKYNDKM